MTIRHGQPPQVWSTPTSRKILTLSEFSNDAQVQFTPNEHILYIIDGRKHYLIEADTGRVIGVLDVIGIVARPDSHDRIQFSPDGRVVAILGPDPMTRLWQTATGRLVAVLNYPDGTVFSPDGKTVATLTYPGKVRLWDVPL